MSNQALQASAKRWIIRHCVGFGGILCGKQDDGQGLAVVEEDLRLISADGS